MSHRRRRLVFDFLTGTFATHVPKPSLKTRRHYHGRDDFVDSRRRRGRGENVALDLGARCISVRFRPRDVQRRPTASSLPRSRSHPPARLRQCPRRIKMRCDAFRQRGYVNPLNGVHNNDRNILMFALNSALPGEGTSPLHRVDYAFQTTNVIPTELND